MPLVLAEAYLNLTVLVFAVGPWAWPVREPLALYCFLAACHVGLGLGYFIGVSTEPRPHARVYSGVHSSSLRITRISIFLAAIKAIPSYLRQTGIASFSVQGVLQGLLAGIINPGQQYASKLAYYAETQTSIPWILFSAITAPLAWLMVPLSMVHWDSLTGAQKIMCIGALVLDIIGWISVGTNKGILDSALLIVIGLAIRQLTRPHRRAPRRSVRVLAVLLMTIPLVYLVITVQSRLGGVSTYGWSSGVGVDWDRPLIAITPRPLKNALIVISSYMTQGYYGLSLAMCEPFSSTFGIGNSLFLTSLFERLFGVTDIVGLTYPGKIEYMGWDRLVNWHSFYTWIASDVSFYGVPFVMILVGWMLAVSWIGASCCGDPYSTGMFTLMVMLVVYIPANNQVFAFYHTWCAFWGLFCVWALKRFSLRIRHARCCGRPYYADSDAAAGRVKEGYR